MSISKAVIMGIVVRDPEKRYTTNNIPITSFAIDLSLSDEPSVLRVITKGKLAEISAEIVKKGKKVIIDGRLQTSTIKTNTGAEKKVMELDAFVVEVVGESTPQPRNDAKQESSDDLGFIDEVSSDSDNLVGEDEIPF